MVNYHGSHFAFELPGRWRDRSINLLRGSDMTMVITRDRPIVTMAKLRSYVEAQLAALARALPSYRLFARNGRAVPPVLGIEVMYQWLDDGAPTYRHQVYLPCHHNLIILTATCAVADRESCSAQLDALLRSMRFRRQDAGEIVAARELS